MELKKKMGKRVLLRNLFLVLSLVYINLHILITDKNYFVGPFEKRA